ncbi:hypothetical protein Xoosp13_30 [Xanthomonas phage Xoo-sp13]|nr:hypothetical protein Xoosp13_30 [Xanthomonas phage Xoo-sp13]
MHKIGCRRQYKFPIQHYMVQGRADSGEWYSVESNTLETMKKCVEFIKGCCGPKVASKFVQYFKRASGVTNGRNRVVLLMGPYVIKFPISWDGHADNDWEGSISNAKEDEPDYNPDNVQYARTRLAYFEKTPILFMEQVKSTDEPYEVLPDWVGYVDCAQVGYNRKGKLVAYDYGIR